MLSEAHVDVSDETVVLLRALFMAVEANKGAPAGASGQALNADGVAVKCFLHAISCLYLNRGTSVPELEADFLDAASMYSLARTTMESFLVFHYVFAGAQTDEERELRYLSWVLAGLFERQELPAILPEGQAKQQYEREVIQRIQQRLQSNSQFGKLSPKQQQALLHGKKWRRRTWREIACDAGLSELHAKHAYGYLCSYAHSGSLSVMQVSQAKTRTDQRDLGEVALRLVNVALAFMVKAYCSVFPKAQAVLENEGQLMAKVNEWLNWAQRAEGGEARQTSAFSGRRPATTLHDAIVTGVCASSIF